MRKIGTLYIDCEDLEDIIIKLQASFKVEFQSDKIENKITIQQLADKLISKLNLKEGNECTSQIVFYKLKKDLIEKLHLKDKDLHPKTKLRDVFPIKGRRQAWKNSIEDFAIHVPRLSPPTYLILTLALFFIAPIIIIPTCSFVYGLILFAASCIGSKLANKFGKSLPTDDLGTLAKIISSENYLDSRKHLNNINTPEIKRHVYNMIIDWQPKEDRKLITMTTKLNYI